MEYSIQELSRLSGVTTRTLRWYDQIGLLKPSRVAESGYRYYGGAEVDRLQDILYYRAMGVELARIKDCLDDPSFDRLAALRNHLAALEAERERLEQLIRSVKDTIGAEERDEIMSDEQKFKAFKQRAVEHNEETYGAEIRAKYGDKEVNEANAAVMNLTQEQYQEWTDLGREIQGRLESAVRAGLFPESDEGKEICALHRRWLTLTGNRYDPAKHRGIAELYVMDERFTAYYDCVALSGPAPYLSVERTCTHVSNSAVVTSTLKTKAAKRKIPLPPPLLHCLQSWRIQNPYDYVVPNSEGGPRSRQSFRRLWEIVENRTAGTSYRWDREKGHNMPVQRTLGEKITNHAIVCSLDFHCTPHQLRHTYITNLCASGLDIKKIQYLAGHANVQMTLNIYAHVVDNRPEDLFDDVCMAFGSAQNIPPTSTP